METYQLEIYFVWEEEREDITIMLNVESYKEVELFIAELTKEGGYLEKVTRINE